MRVAVIGAGVVGAAVARDLAVRGATVTVFEQRHPGDGTSGTSFAWLNSHDKHPEIYHRLNVEGCLEHARLAAGFPGGAPWYFPTGNVAWAGDPEGRATLERRVTRLDRLGYPCRWVTHDEVGRLEPDVRVPEDVERIAYFPGEGHVLPAVLLAHLLGQARECGARLLFPAVVTAVEPHQRGVDVRLDGGESHRFDRVISCAGRWTEALVATADRTVPMAEATQPGGANLGLLAYTRPLPVRLSRVLTTPRLNVRPDGGGRLVMQGLDLDAGTEADPAAVGDAAAPPADTLIQRLGEVLAGGEFATIEALRVGRRALPADGLTVAGFADGETRRFYVIATHSGITLAPLLARLAAGEVLDEQASPLLASFRPDRFRHAAGTGPVTPARRPGEQ
ncbi:FAD-binding oxidoreductase [Haloechinothrix sp. YIM 98757]|uniref:FAD-binding oxidoreductase n=1 Tax=Haloechinothrix aidingensis TaxID=2752311 RepID=A0A838AG45_9PSEU|nr:FAD-dependent oxidoreductase [Haloechinothrix aidingensis]MBA0128212.1 FAD-binding oxidoreductase [Haloechinothrix aidingensis]